MRQVQKQQQITPQQDIMKQIAKTRMKVRADSCECQFEDDRQKKEYIAKFLEDFGDDLPPEAIKESVKKLANWKLECDCNDRSRIISSGKWEKSDWYLCTIKNLATHPDWRGMGLASKVTEKLIDDAIDGGCLVLAMDIRKTNYPSLAVAKKRGFRAVNEFCWAENEEPAVVLQWVKFAPLDGNKCILPTEEI